MKNIDIDIPDDSQFTHIALILDSRDGLEKEIFQLRKKWVAANETTDLDNWKKSLPIGKYQTFLDDIFSLLKKYTLSILYFSVIEQAIILGKIKRWKRIQRIVIPYSILEELYRFEEENIQEGKYEYALVTPIEANKKEVEKEYAELKNDIRKSQSSDWGSLFLYNILSDTKDTIRKVRNWYKKYAHGFSPRDIAIEENIGSHYYAKAKEAIDKHLYKTDTGLQNEYYYYLKNIDNYADKVEKAINRYKKLLKTVPFADI